MDKMLFVLERIYQMTKIPVRYYDKVSNTTLFSRGYEVSADPFLCDCHLWNRLTERITAASPPIIMEEEIFLYAVFMDLSGCCVMLGPVCRMHIDSEQKQQYAKKHSVPLEGFFIHHKTFSELYSAIATTYLCITGNYIYESDIIEVFDAICHDKAIGDNEYMAYVLDSTEREALQAFLPEELEYVQLIRDGDIDGLNTYTRSFDVSAMDQYTQNLAIKTYKQHEYLACANITITTRAAIDGGVDPQAAYSLGNLYLQRLEKCTKLVEILDLQTGVAESFVKLVHQAKAACSGLSYIEKIKVYIMKHLNRPFTLKDVAKEVNINMSYLSRRFSEAEGIGIKQYTQNKRLDVAANMLKFSDEHISTISNYLCFPSQSRFSIVFRERFGMTPYKYREKNKIIT